MRSYQCPSLPCCLSAPTTSNIKAACCYRCFCCLLLIITRYGKSFPRAPHHRASSCPSRETNSTCRCSTAPNFYTLYGALVGGPNMDDTYADACPDFQKNEVS